ncbi:hypothetical protein [Lacinutrix venerupis]|uniref:Uncharacterized protein n=1 Tax=Lacinutrix venerupis TaxID=1486034 RepID=A0AAC9PWQ3_9FLAO|nr:hypothetical protein [Lacinutrix venerupis]APY01087.1 hypothetical protein BWR22_12470 [Lacinutrix venerupis]
MKKLLLAALLVLISSFSIAQGTEAKEVNEIDEVYKHNGEVVKGKVVRVEEYTIVFVYQGEDTEYTIGKYAVEKIKHNSGRVEDITDKIIVNNKDDWENVVILEDKSYIAGLKKGSEVRGKTGLINFQTGNTGDKKAEKKLKMAAAKNGHPFILLTSDKSTVGASSNRLGGSQAIKKGVSYMY